MYIFFYHFYWIKQRPRMNMAKNNGLTGVLLGFVIKIIKIISNSIGIHYKRTYYFAFRWNCITATKKSNKMCYILLLVTEWKVINVL